MSTENLPPFYVGQKVVCLKTSPTGVPKKGCTYTVQACFQCPECKEWHIKIFEVASPYTKYSCCIPIKTTGKYIGGPAKYFAPIHENFESISLSKVLEEETKLISVN